MISIRILLAGTLLAAGALLTAATSISLATAADDATTARPLPWGRMAGTTWSRAPVRPS